MKKILIVEDSRPILQLHIYLVKRAGFEPVTAKTLEEVKAFESQLDDFFCAIIDYSLPDAPDGEAIQYLLGKKVPGIVVTGMIDDKIRERIFRLPVIDYITKESKQAFNYLENLLVKLNNNHTVKMLVVDDSASSRAYLHSMLSRHNYDVLVADSGVEALKVLDDNPDIKLVITDKEMPNMDGIKLCNEIRAKYSKDEISIIGVSGADNPSLTAKFIKNGANDFLKKPFCHEEFYCRVIQNIEYIQSIDTIKRQANTDYLTGLFNRRYYFETVAPVVQEDVPLTLAMMDIDHFKQVNDTYGHEAGDVVLKTVASLLEKHFSENYVVSRIGGEEFSVYFDQLSLDETVDKLEAFRGELESLVIHTQGFDIKCTISIGVTNKIYQHLDNLINHADGLLYTAKQNGRNRVEAG